VIDGVSLASVRVVTGGLTGVAFGVGSRPVAEYRGWLALLREHPEQARSQGQAMLDFVADQKETKWNRWFLRTLAAEGHLFSGTRGGRVPWLPKLSRSRHARLTTSAGSAPRSWVHA